jgi:hypothetical protein
MDELSLEKEEVEIEAPPFLGSWKRIYAAVLIYLAALIAVLYFFSHTLVS